MRINHFFEKGYYINLDRRTDRKEEFEQEMEKHDLPGFFERFSGIDAINEPDHIKKHYYCAQTFYNLYQKIYDEGYENVVIFEDGINTFLLLGYILYSTKEDNKF